MVYQACFWNVKSKEVSGVGTVEVQNEIPKDVPPRYADYFELKAIATSSSGETSACPFYYYL